MTLLPLQLCPNQLAPCVLHLWVWADLSPQQSWATCPGPVVREASQSASLCGMLAWEEWAQVSKFLALWHSCKPSFQFCPWPPDSSLSDLELLQNSRLWKDLREGGGSILAALTKKYLGKMFLKFQSPASYHGISFQTETDFFETRREYRTISSFKFHSGKVVEFGTSPLLPSFPSLPHSSPLPACHSVPTPSTQRLLACLDV